MQVMGKNLNDYVAVSPEKVQNCRGFPCGRNLLCQQYTDKSCCKFS